MLPPDGVLVMPPIPVFEPGFGFTRFETPVHFSPPEATPVHFSPPEAQAQSQTLSQAYMTPNNSGSDEAEPDRAPSSAEERRRRRMISNRESARRSRMRKQRHLEDLRSQANRLRSENRDLANRLGAVSHHCLLFRRDNDRLRSESAELRHRLSEIRQLLTFRQLQRLVAPSAAVACGGFASVNEQTLAAAAYGGFAPGNEQTLIV